MPTNRCSVQSKALAVFTRHSVRMRRRQWGIVAVGVLGWIKPASAEYHLEVADLIEVWVTRLPDLQRRVPVQVDGSISFPLLGTVPVAGLSRSEAEAKIRARLAGKVFRYRAPDGREISVIIEPEDVTATVVEYRPIYVNGEVAKPGEHPYRPSMTVRQAIALSGGFDVMHVKTSNTAMEAAELRGEYESLWTEFAKQRAQVARIKTELGDKDKLDPNVLSEVPMAQTTLADIMTVEAEQLKNRQADYHREKAFLQHAVKQGDEQVGVLSAQAQKEEQGVQADQDELQKVTELFGKGSLTSVRVTDARRAVLLSSTRKLQTTAQLLLIKKQQDDFARVLERLDDQRKIALFRELQEANLRLLTVRAKLQSTAEKLQHLAGAPRLINGTRSKPEIILHRKGQKGWERFVTDEDSELQPGDVLEVGLRVERTAEGPPP
jgi:polysaccharide biosynthesis/export protein